MLQGMFTTVLVQMSAFLFTDALWLATTEKERNSPHYFLPR